MGETRVEPPARRPSSPSDLSRELDELLRTFGPSKSMGDPSPDEHQPHYFLIRRFLRFLDLLIILNTKRCRYRCTFCNLPAKSSPTTIEGSSIVAQVSYTLDQCRHALGVLDRVTLSNDGSVLDESTVDPNALTQIVSALERLRQLQTVVLETRMEFVSTAKLRALGVESSRLTFDVLTGFESSNERIRNTVLGKRESLSVFQGGLDVLAQFTQAQLTAYVLVKPDPLMSDAEAVDDAKASIRYLQDETDLRDIPLAVRLNPMYLAERTTWTDTALKQGYVPPRLTDVLTVAAWARARGIQTYIGLSAEGLASGSGTYRGRSDFTKTLLKRAIAFNHAT